MVNWKCLLCFLAEEAIIRREEFVRDEKKDCITGKFPIFAFFS